MSSRNVAGVICHDFRFGRPASIKNNTIGAAYLIKFQSHPLPPAPSPHDHGVL
jgi:hypothetical protein